MINRYASNIAKVKGQEQEKAVYPTLISEKNKPVFSSIPESPITVFIAGKWVG